MFESRISLHRKLVVRWDHPEHFIFFFHKRNISPIEFIHKKKSMAFQNENIFVDYTEEDEFFWSILVKARVFMLKKKVKSGERTRKSCARYLQGKSNGMLSMIYTPQQENQLEAINEHFLRFFWIIEIDYFGFDSWEIRNISF